MKQNDILDEIKRRLDIVELISEYVPLKKAGSNYKGLCPFHPEKTPSFTVSPSKQFFYCFGCGEGGDVITFIKKIENLSFHETLERLARRIGIEYKPGSGRDFENSRKSLLLTILKEAAEFYRKSLKENPNALEYLMTVRSLTEESINRFFLGYAPSGWDSLLLYLKGKGFREAHIKDAGLLSYSEKGSYDLFRNRIMFPIQDLQGEIIGFGGRVMDDSTPKYINSPETILFKKGETLFGLFQAKEFIKKLGYVVITEGYLDVIMCAQYGFRNVVAPLGTALTERQVLVLKRLADRIILLYDGDKAGINAARRAIPILLSQSVRPLVVLLPEGEDPDSFLKKNPPSRMAGLIQSPLGLVEFYLKISQPMDTETLRELTGIIASIDDPLMRAEYIKRLSELAGFKEEFLIEEVVRLRKQKESKGNSAGDRIVTRVYGTLTGTPKSFQGKFFGVPTKVLSPEALLIATVLQYPQRAGTIFKVLRSDDVEDENLRELYNLLLVIYRERPEAFEDSTSLFHVVINLLSSHDDESSSLSGYEPDQGVAKGTIEGEMKEGEDISSRLQGYMAHLTFNIHIEEEGIDRLVSDCFMQIRIRTLDRLIDEARARNDLILLNNLVKERARMVS